MAGTRRCEKCDRPNPVELAMKVKSGQTLTMLSCSGCEARSWLADGEPIAKEDMLKLTSGDPDFAMRTSSQRRDAPGSKASIRGT
jgi:hypothetical protein